MKKTIYISPNLMKKLPTQYNVKRYTTKVQIKSKRHPKVQWVKNQQSRIGRGNLESDESRHQTKKSLWKLIEGEQSYWKWRKNS